MPQVDSEVHMRIRLTKNELGWLLLILLVHYLIGVLLWFQIAWWADVIWLFLGLPLGYAMGRYFKRRDKRRLADEWRATHPTLSDYWLPKELK
jgi:hypothetical protein